MKLQKGMCCQKLPPHGGHHQLDTSLVQQEGRQGANQSLAAGSLENQGVIWAECGGND